MSKNTYSYYCEVCPYIEVLTWDLASTLTRVPYCKYCVIPMKRHYGTITPTETLAIGVDDADL